MQHQQELNEEQKKIYNAIKDQFDAVEKLQKLFFINGPSGAGKTFLLNQLIEYFEEKRHQSVISVAYTGVGATLLKYGRTIHWTFNLDWNLNESSESLHNEDSQSELIDALNTSDVIIWDQANYTPKYAFSAADRYLKRNNNKVFGGKFLIVAGDFSQIFPIGEKRWELTLMHSDYWQLFKPLQLVQNIRNNNMIDHRNPTQLEAFFGEPLLAADPPLNKVILAYRNTEVDEVNEKTLRLLEGDPRSYKGLKLKIGAIVMLTEHTPDLSLRNGYCKGLRMVVEEMSDDEIKCRIKTPGLQYDQVLVIAAGSEQPVSLGLAYAMTIDKAQGLTIDHVGLYQIRPNFNNFLTDGHMYVAQNICRISLCDIQV